MLFSQRCVYAIRAVLYLVCHADAAPVPVREISGALDLPHAFLAKTLRVLVQAGLLTTQPGSKGGLALARPARAITLRDIVLAIDGPSLFEACVLRLPACNAQQPCPLHEAWVHTRTRIDAMLAEATLDAVAEAARTKGFLLPESPSPGF